MAPAVVSAWEDQFVRPSRDDLLEGLNKQDRALVDRCLSRLESIPRCRMGIAWHGIPWRWTLRFTTDNKTPVAFIIPEPRRPQLAIPLSADDMDRLDFRKLSRAIREGISLASAINGIVWSEWVLSSKTQTDELLKLLDARLIGVGLVESPES
ncbi:MAG: hypothetical protein D6695_11035 [Planctomycetota bacterium]|nr:MAG: hypothetical protein D6695_11035 [Planctomycetota bacterium]